MKISMKKRKIGYTYGSVSGHFAFRKQKSIAFESTLERDLLTLLEFNDSVCDVIEQPVTLHYENVNGRDVTYTPDFLVYFDEPETTLLKIKRKPWLIEVKPKKKLLKDWKELRPRFKIATRYAQDNDFIFKIFDEEKIRGQYLKNILFLKRYKSLKYNKDEEQRILEYVETLGSTDVDHILECLYATKEQKGIALGQVWNLLANKKLLCKYDDALNYNTIVWTNNNINMEFENE